MREGAADPVLDRVPARLEAEGVMAADLLRLDRAARVTGGSDEESDRRQGDRDEDVRPRAREDDRDSLPSALAPVRVVTEPVAQLVEAPPGRPLARRRQLGFVHRLLELG